MGAERVRDGVHAQAVASEIAARGGQAQAVTLDLADVAGIAPAIGTLCETFGSIDILVNNAAVVLARRFLETSLEDLRGVMAVNLEAPFACAQAVAAPMIARGSGRTVIMASHSGLLGRTSRSAYAAQKGAVNPPPRRIPAQPAPEQT